jgi:16S rRNA (guanine527-N7)-methyltransferase
VTGQRAAAVKDAHDFARTFSVSRETLERLGSYEALLRQWQKTINLVAPSTLPDIWSRHFADSAQLLALAPPGAKRWLDLGSGAGFPGLVVAILLAEQDQRHVTLIESDTRKASFLREVARQTGVPVDILCRRIEKGATHDSVVSRETDACGKWDVITARALAPLPRLLDLSAPCFSSDTVGFFLKGREAQAEIEAAQRHWQFSVKLHPSLTDADARIVEVRALQAKTEVHSR